jgi:DNA-binding GntR family transcriptional regulator
MTSTAMDTPVTNNERQTVRRLGRGPTPTHHRVGDLLRQAIVAGEYLDGERLVVDELARRYETSAMPVRQALHQLESEGLVETVLNRGARVRRVDRSLAENLYDLRRAVLALLVERCIERMTDDDIAALVALERNARNAGTAEEGFERNESFLAKIGEVADIPLASEVLSRSWPLMCAVRRVYGVRDRRIGRDDRKRLLEAIERRDASAAVAIVVESAQAAKADLIERLTHLREDKGAAAGAASGGSR